jgi:hypothetical protein
MVRAAQQEIGSLRFMPQIHVEDDVSHDSPIAAFGLKADVHS